MISSINGKKILVFGGIGSMGDLITLAHRNGVKVGVADYNKGTYLKKQADYAHALRFPCCFRACQRTGGKSGIVYDGF